MGLRVVGVVHLREVAADLLVAVVSLLGRHSNRPCKALLHGQFVALHYTLLLYLLLLIC